MNHLKKGNTYLNIYIKVFDRRLRTHHQCLPPPTSARFPPLRVSQAELQKSSWAPTWGWRRLCPCQRPCTYIYFIGTLNVHVTINNEWMNACMPPGSRSLCRTQTSSLSSSDRTQGTPWPRYNYNIMNWDIYLISDLYVMYYERSV